MMAMLEAKLEYDTDQLCREPQTGIKGGVHAIQIMRSKMKEEEEMGFLLIDARNTSNEANRTKML